MITCGSHMNGSTTTTTMYSHMSPKKKLEQPTLLSGCQNTSINRLQLLIINQLQLLTNIKQLQMHINQLKVRINIKQLSVLISINQVQLLLTLDCINHEKTDGDIQPVKCADEIDGSTSFITLKFSSVLSQPALNNSFLLSTNT